MKSKYFFVVAICAICHIELSKAQNSNSTTRGFMTQVNSWISRLRGNHNNSNNNNNSDKDKESEKKNNYQNQPMQYPGMMPFPVMPGLYGPMTPMAMPFAPRPLPATGFAPPMPYGSLTAAGSSLGPSIGASLPMGPSLGASFGQLSPSYTSASHMMPVHHSYHDATQDYPVGYGMANTFGNSFGGLSNANYGNLGGGHSMDQQMNDNTYNGEQVDQNNGDEYSGYQR